jgi:hypothetical protein
LIVVTSAASRQSLPNTLLNTRDEGKNPTVDGRNAASIRATLLECVDPDSLRVFFESVQERRDFYSSKAKSPYHKIPIGSPSTDLRGDVAERIYDIRNRIVHTKNDPRDGEVELLLPFSDDAEQLSFDIELVQFLAQAALIAASLPFKVN